ncbi:small ubiquitin-related modifier-like [Drosophila subobscura]|uniref:small ubiquitin-related modifier-like n=1 Tax=Drosophila subobscura TaxID=7241 RepID=UPI00155A6245|nr:small ubiquitin-related modifier-like [Drosophila subobscura]
MTQKKNTKFVERILIKVEAVHHCFNHCNVVRGFVMKRNSNFKQLKAVTAKEIGIRGYYLRYLYNGRFFNETETPQSMGMEDGDTINIFFIMGGPPKEAMAVEQLFENFLLRQNVPGAQWQIQ